MRKPNPLQWPDGLTRTTPEEREASTFRVTMAEAIEDLLREARLLGVLHIVITSDLPTRSDGLPYASGRCQDPGVAVWMITPEATERVIACDRWATPAANIRAIGKTIEALRGVQRWGSATMVNQAFQGFAALPAPPSSPAPDVVDIEGDAQ